MQNILPKVSDLKFTLNLENTYINQFSPTNQTTDIHGLVNLISRPNRMAYAKRMQVQYESRSLNGAVYMSSAERKKAKESIDYHKQNLGVYYPNFDGQKFNGCIGFDFDSTYEGVSDDIKEALKKLPFVVLSHTSASGYGLKGLFLTDLTDCDKDLYTFAEKKIFEVLRANGITDEYDPHGVTKHCYFAYDPKPYVNYDAQPFHIDLDAYEAEKQAQQAAEQLAKDVRKSVIGEKDSQDLASKAVKYLIDNNVCVASCYNEYVAFTGACIEVFDEVGSDIAFDVLMCSDTFRVSSFKKNFSKNAKSIYKSNSEKKAGLGSILYHAFKGGLRYSQPIAPTADNSIEALEGEKLTDVLKRLNITPEQLANKKLIAPTGLGKGFLVNYIADTTGESVILVCPNTLLLMQFVERHGFTPFYANTDPELLRGAKKIAVTYHSFARLSNLIDVPEHRVFLDESQNFTSGASNGYLLKPLNSVIDCLRNKAFKSVTLLTGTDVFNFHPYFGQFQTLEVMAVRKAIRYIITDCADILATAAVKAIDSIKTKRTPIIFLNNKGTKLAKLKTLLGETKVTVINADEKGSTDFENIVKNGLISNEVECLICTSSLKEGNDILNNYSFDFIVADAKIGSIELRQLVGRARNAQDVSLHILKSENREKSVFAYNITKRSAKLRSQANDECLELNEGNYDFNTNQLAEKIRKGVQDVAICINTNNVFEVDYLLLSNMVYTEMVSCEYANDSYQQTNLERLGFKLLGNETDATETDASIKDELKAAKQAEKEVFETEYAQHIETLKAVPDVQKQIELMQTGSKAAKMIVDRVEKLQDEFTLSPADCIELIADKSKKTDFNLLVDRMRVQNYLTGKADDTKLSIFYKSLSAKFEVGQYYTPDEIREKVLKSVELLKTVDMVKFDKDKERNTNILKELRKVFEVHSIVKKVEGKCEKIFRIEKVTLVCLNKVNQTKVTFQSEVFEDAPF
jgi:hypothetical protein